MAKECSNTSCIKSSCEGCGQKQPQSLMAEPNVFSDVKHVIGVVSGKGVGQRTVLLNKRFLRPPCNCHQTAGEYQ